MKATVSIVAMAMVANDDCITVATVRYGYGSHGYGVLWLRSPLDKIYRSHQKSNVSGVLCIIVHRCHELPQDRTFIGSKLELGQ